VRKLIAPLAPTPPAPPVSSSEATIRLFRATVMSVSMVASDCPAGSLAVLVQVFPWFLEAKTAAGPEFMLVMT
jgi:hypothetical protein